MQKAHSVRMGMISCIVEVSQDNGSISKVYHMTYSKFLFIFYLRSCIIEIDDQLCQNVPASIQKMTKRYNGGIWEI